MSTLSKKQIQRATSDPDLKIKPLDSSNGNGKSVSSASYGFQESNHLWNKINFGMVSSSFIRLVIVIVTAITLMELERAL